MRSVSAWRVTANLARQARALTLLFRGIKSYVQYHSSTGRARDWVKGDRRSGLISRGGLELGGIHAAGEGYTARRGAAFRIGGGGWFVTTSSGSTRVSARQNERTSGGVPSSTHPPRT